MSYRQPEIKLLQLKYEKTVILTILIINHIFN
ncbi:hypothetical protein PoMZ_01693 [Pyricularia oryzae]|uniref:Uncharacterized protein n=1 Tax=Pyricularia oryzae TaxID=318829 RepID=A0A4P7N2U9_PYROR|nr:hypothetical protein PoMZ_01693 [Pyricularia oryzae]